jgi:branched-chain amino acid transport system substrate-binding protein
MKTRARLGVALLVSALAATACGSRLQTAELQAANGVMTKHGNGAGGPGAGGAAGPAAGPGAASDGAAGATAAASPLAASSSNGATGSGTAGGGLAGPAASGGAATSAAGGSAAGRSSSQAAGAAGPSAASARTAGGTAGAAGGAASSANSGTGGGTGSPGAGAVPGGAAGGSKSEILLGSFGAASGILGAVTGTVPPAIRAWSSYINAKGGLAGHPVRIILADDAGDPARTQAIVHQMVEQNHVVAFFAHYSFTVTGLEKYLESKGVPLIGGTGGDIAEDHSKVIYEPLMGADEGGAWGFLLAIAAQTDKKKIAVLYCREVAQCAKKIADMKAKLPYNGMNIVYETQVSLAQPDYTAEMIQAQRAGAEVVMTMVDSATLGRLAQSAHRQGYTPLFSGPWNLDIDPTIASVSKELDGQFLGPARTPMYQTSPKLADYREAMARYQPKDALGGLGAAVFVFGKLLEKIAPTFGPTVTGDQLITALNALHGEKLDGFLPGITFPNSDDRTKVNQCVIPYTLRGGTFVAWKPTEEFFCAPGWSPAS